MALTAFSVGRDTQLVVMGPNGRVDLSHVTGFESRQITNPIRVSRLDGTQLAAELPKGWEEPLRSSVGRQHLMISSRF